MLQVDATIAASVFSPTGAPAITEPLSGITASYAVDGEYALLGVGLLGLCFRRSIGALREILWPGASGQPDEDL